MSGDGRSRLTDELGIMAIDATDYPAIGETDRATTVNLASLQQALELVETLGWHTIDIGIAKPDGGDIDNPLLVIEPPHAGLFAGDEQAAISVAPITDDGRDKLAVGEGSEP